jgi:predicted RNA-binding Zn-ribbon protein involved in translation (DUF1610 family)
MSWPEKRRRRREAREAELDRQDREAASRLANLAPAEVAADGKCPGCGSRQFRPLETAGEAAARGFLAGGLAGSAAAANQGFTECVTCGKVFRKG